MFPLDVLYPEQHQAGTIGSLWELHHLAFADFVISQSPNNVFEIGGAHGILAKNVNEKIKTSWKILEPNPAPIPDCPAIFEEGFLIAIIKLTQR